MSLSLLFVVSWRIMSSSVLVHVFVSVCFQCLLPCPCKSPVVNHLSFLITCCNCWLGPPVTREMTQFRVTVCEALVPPLWCCPSPPTSACFHSCPASLPRSSVAVTSLPSLPLRRLPPKTPVAALPSALASLPFSCADERDWRTTHTH